MNTYASGIAAIISGVGSRCDVKYVSKSGFDASLATSKFKVSWALGLSRNTHFLLKMITCFRLSPTYAFAIATAFCKPLSISDSTNEEGFRHEDYAVFPWCIAPLNIIDSVYDVITLWVNNSINLPSSVSSGKIQSCFIYTPAIWIPSWTNLQERRMGELEQGTGNL